MARTLKGYFQCVYWVFIELGWVFRVPRRNEDVLAFAVCVLPRLRLGLGGSSRTDFVFYWKTTRLSKIFILLRISCPACLDAVFCLINIFTTSARLDCNIVFFFR